MATTASVTTVSTNRVINVAGGNLYAIAAQYLGDATKWYQVAAQNGLTDPMITGLAELTLPQSNIASNGGILGY